MMVLKVVVLMIETDWILFALSATANILRSSHHLTCIGTDRRFYLCKEVGRCNGPFIS